MNIEEMQKAMERHNKGGQYRRIVNRHKIILEGRPSWYYGPAVHLEPEGERTACGTRFLCDPQQPFKLFLHGVHLFDVNPAAHTLTFVNTPWPSTFWRVNHYLPGRMRLDYLKYNRYTPGQTLITGNHAYLLKAGLVIHEDGLIEGAQRAIKVTPTKESGVRLRHILKRIKDMVTPMDHWRSTGPGNYGSFSHEAMEERRKTSVQDRAKRLLHWAEGRSTKYNAEIHLTVISFNPYPWYEKSEHQVVTLDYCMDNAKRHIRAALCTTPL